LSAARIDVVDLDGLLATMLRPQDLACEIHHGFNRQRTLRNTRQTRHGGRRSSQICEFENSTNSPNKSPRFPADYFIFRFCCAGVDMHGHPVSLSPNAQIPRPSRYRVSRIAHLIGMHSNSTLAKLSPRDT